MTVRVVSLSENKGFAEGANIGAKESKGKSPSIYEQRYMETRPDWLTNAISKLLSEKTIGAVQCKIMQYKNKGMIDVIGHSVDTSGVVHMIGHDEKDRGQ